MKKIAVKCAAALMNLIYLFLKLLPVEHKVVMISRQGNTPSADFRLLKRQLLKQDPDVRVVMLCRMLDGKLQASPAALLRYGFHMLHQMYEMATCEVVVLDTYCIAASLLHHRRGLQIIQIWHSMGNMKKFGYTALDTDEGVPADSAHLLHMHENYTCIFASSEVYAEDLAAGFGYSADIVKVMPLPRCDLLHSHKWMDRKRQQILKRYPHLLGRRVILYCPTFRQEEDDFIEAVRALSEAIDPQREMLIFNPHILSNVRARGEGVLCGTPFSSFELLSAADAVITDYSCIAYEAAFAGVPLYFYDFDMDEYLSERGLAIDFYAEIPGPASHDPEELMRLIRAQACDRRKVRAFAEKYIRYSGHAAADMAGYILSCTE